MTQPFLISMAPVQAISIETHDFLDMLSSFHLDGLFACWLQMTLRLSMHFHSQK